MSHFYGTLFGASPKKVTRCGTAETGLTAIAASWNGAVEVALYVKDGVDFARVYLVPWFGKGTKRLLYEGPVSG